MGDYPRPSTPPSSRQQWRHIPDQSTDSPLSIHRNVRRRLDLEPPPPPTPDPQFSTVFEFHVYLPNRSSVEVRVGGAEKCRALTVARFVRLVREELDKCGEQAVKQKQRGVVWGNHVHVEDFYGNPVDGVGEFAKGHESKAARVLLLFDGHPDTVHAHSGFWNVTPEPQMLGVLPQDYTLFSALADEVDNSLQAIFQLEAGKQRLICVNLDHKEGKISIYDTGKGMDSTPQNCISKWGTIGSSMNRHSVVEAIGGKPPYLKPNFGMYGFGGIGAGLHLGGVITVSSKTEVSRRVAILHLGRKALTTSVKTGSVWKTGGEFRAPTQQELEWSPHGSFTKVEISDLSWRVQSWKVEEVQRKLKDYYFPYIQNDEGEGGMTDTPVEIRVNGDDLAGIVGGEVTHSNFHSSRGEPYVIILEFTKPKETNASEHAGDGVDRANARIICHYFPIIKGREAIDDIIVAIKAEDSDFSEDFESFSRRSIRRLGRLLPDAGRVLPEDRSAGRLPFMEPKRFFREKEVNRHCYKRVKALIDVDAGFIPTTSKMDLVQKHPFTKALLELGLGLQTEDTAKKTLKKGPGPVNISITRISKESGNSKLRPQDLHADYTTWITQQHENFDIGAIFNDGVIIATREHHKQELNITKDVFRVVYDITCNKVDWKVGKDKAPVHLKLLKGLPGLKNDDKDMFVTLECFISDGLPDEKGETKIICRPIEVPEQRGSKVEGGEDQGQLLSFSLGESRSFPIETLFGDKYEVVTEEPIWQRRLAVVNSKLPAFIQLLNAPEVSKLAGLKTLRENVTLGAGATLQQELVAVVRQRAYLGQAFLGGPRLEQKYIFAEAMEMKLEVFQVKTPAPSWSQIPVQISALNAERKHETKAAACSRGGLKGLYCFRLAGGELEGFLRTSGTYVFVFTLVSVKYEEVRKLKFRIDITPSSKIGHWKICSHSGNCSDHHRDRNPEVMKVRLGEVLPVALYLTRVDEFGNSMEFARIPTDVRCDIYTVAGDPVEVSVTIVKDVIKISDDLLSLEIPRIEVGGGKLTLLKRTIMQAALEMSVDGNPAADFPIAVLPGPAAVARMKESNYAPIISRLRPGQVVEHLTFEVLDGYRNPVSSGEKVTVILDGFVWQDQLGYQRSVDENGCLDLGMRLRVTAGYGETARVELRTAENLRLWVTTLEVINRKLRIRNDISERVPAGSQLKDIVIEAVDEDGQVDIAMDGAAHSLSLDWDPNIAVKLREGRCTLPTIHVPHTPGAFWKGCVAHTNNPGLQILITVVIEEHESNSDAPPAVNNHNSEPRTINLRKQAAVVRDSSHDINEHAGDNRKHRIHVEAVELQAAFDRRKKLEDKLQKLHQKVKKYDNDLNRLRRTKREHEDALKRYQSELEVLGKEVKSEAAHDEDSTAFDCTLTQMTQRISELGNPPGSHAAALLLQAQREGFSEIKDVKGIIGIVALLGSVAKEEYNRALVEFLGPEDMLAIVCDSRSAAESLGIPPATGAPDKTKGLLGFVKSRNLKISGRYRVISLTEESSFYPTIDDVLPEGTPAIDDADPQKLLNISPAASKPGSERLVGSLGYAVNMVHLSGDQLRIRVRGRGLRETLFFGLFGYLEVFDTTSNMLRARKSIRTTAVSLDGGLIRKRNQYELGSREDPVVWFPGTLQKHSSKQAKGCTLPERAISTAAKRMSELNQRRERERQSYLAGQTEADLVRTTDLLKRAKQKIADNEQLIKAANVAAISRNVAKLKDGTPPGKPQGWDTNKKQ